MRDRQYGKRWIGFNNVYTYRNDNLMRLGFKSYRAYLASALWKSIRGRVLAENPKCVSCRRAPATQVHHRSYDMATLKGELLWSLSAVCATCHKWAEQPKKRRAAQDRFVEASEAILKPSRKMRRAAVRALHRQREQVIARYEDFAPCWAVKP